MPIKNIFKKRQGNQVVSEMKPEETPEPNDLDGFLRRAWAFRSRGKQTEAEADFKRALEIDTESIDALYGLGIVYKSQGKKELAMDHFKKAVNLIEAGKIADHTRADMLRLLTLAHINDLTIGDWNLEQEIWHRDLITGKYE